MVQHKGDGMAERLSEKTAAEMPHVLRSHSLDMVAIHQSAEYRLYPIAETGEKRACARSGVALGSLERSYKIDLLTGQIICQSGTPVVSIAQDCAETPGSELGSVCIKLAHRVKYCTKTIPAQQHDMRRPCTQACRVKDIGLLALHNKFVLHIKWAISAQ